MAAVSSMRAVLEQAQPPTQQQLSRTPSSSSRRGPGRPQGSRQSNPATTEPSSPSSQHRLLSPVEQIEPPGRLPPPPLTALASAAAEFGESSRSQSGGSTSTPAADGDIHSGLWEAVEELKQGKSNVE